MASLTLLPRYYDVTNSSTHATMTSLTLQVSKWYNVVIFTASISEYGTPVITTLDSGRNILARRFFREVWTMTSLTLLL